MSATLIRGQQAREYFRQFRAKLENMNCWLTAIIDSDGWVTVFKDDNDVIKAFWNKNQFVINIRQDDWNVSRLNKILNVLQEYADNMEKLHDQKK